MVRIIVARIFIAAIILAGVKIAADGYLISYDDDGKNRFSASERMKKIAQSAEKARQLAEARASDNASNDGLQAELRAARIQLAQSVAASDALHATQATAATRQAELLASRQHADALAAELASSKREIAQSAEKARQLAEARASEKAGNDGLQAGLLASRQQADALASSQHAAVQLGEAKASGKFGNDRIQADLRAARQQAATRLIPPLPQLWPKSSSVEAKGSSYDDARVILRFRTGSDKARSQAISINLALADFGVAPISISEDAKTAPGTRVRYFYRQDQPLAEKLADSIKSPLPHRASIPKSETPYPGTVEISVGG